MSETPRTDEYAGISEDFRGVEVVPADISRELEKRLAEAQADLANKDRQLAEARAEIERKDKLIERMRDALSLILEGAIHDFHYVCQHRNSCLCWGCQKKRVNAALAAERGV